MADNEGIPSVTNCVDSFDKKHYNNKATLNTNKQV